MVVSKTIYHIHINIKMQNPNQESPVSSETPNQDLKDMDVLCTFRIKMSQNLEWMNQQLVTISKSRPGCQTQVTSLHRFSKPKNGNGCSLHLQNQDRKPKFKQRVYQRPVTISKSRSRCQPPIRSLQHPLKPPMRT